jgi:hypothetical protein
LTGGSPAGTLHETGRSNGVDLEAEVALVVCRWLLALAGIVIGLLAYYRASLRVDIPNTLMQENAKLKGDLKALTVSVEQMMGAFEDRMNAAQKRAAAYASHESRRANTAEAAEGEGDVQDVQAQPIGASAFVGGDGPVTGRLAAVAASDPHTARKMIRNARVMANRGGR